MGKKEQSNKIGQIVARAWADKEFMQKLLADATAVLKEEGVDVPEGVSVKAVENSTTLIHLVIPPKPTRQLSDAELNQVISKCGTPYDCKDCDPYASQLI